MLVRNSSSGSPANYGEISRLLSNPDITSTVRINRRVQNVLCITFILDDLYIDNNPLDTIGSENRKNRTV